MKETKRYLSFLTMLDNENNTNVIDVFEQVRLSFGIPNDYFICFFSFESISFENKYDINNTITINIMNNQEKLNTFVTYIKMTQTDSVQEAFESYEKIKKELSNISINRELIPHGEINTSFILRENIILLDEYNAIARKMTDVKVEINEKSSFNSNLFHILFNEVLKYAFYDIFALKLNAQDLLFLSNLFYNERSLLNKSKVSNYNYDNFKKSFIDISEIMKWKDFIEFDKNEISKSSKELLKINYQR